LAFCLPDGDTSALVAVRIREPVGSWGWLASFGGARSDRPVGEVIEIPRVGGGTESWRVVARDDDAEPRVIYFEYAATPPAEPLAARLSGRPSRADGSPAALEAVKQARQLAPVGVSAIASMSSREPEDTSRIELLLERWEQTAPTRKKGER
jgi:hypothetical protein